MKWAAVMWGGASTDVVESRWLTDLTWEGLAPCVSTARPIVNLYGDGVDNIELNEFVAIGEAGMVVPSQIPQPPWFMLVGEPS